MTEPHNKLEITGDARPSVPVFTCLIYVQHSDDGTVIGRVANLAGIEATGSSLRRVSAKQSRPWNWFASTGVNRGVNLGPLNSLVACLIGERVPLARFRELRLPGQALSISTTRLLDFELADNLLQFLG